MHVLLLNGQPEIGKSWLANQLHSILLANFKTKRYSLAQPIREQATSELGWSGIHGTYDEFKQTTFEWNGERITGRKRMIDIGLEEVRKDQNHWCRQTYQRIKEDKCELAIIDDCGFKHEVDFFMTYAFDLAVIVMAGTEYSIGAQYKLPSGELDSRRCVYPLNGYRSINSTAALNEFNRRLDDARNKPERYSNFWQGLALGEFLV